MRIDPLSRAASRRASGMKPRMIRKCIAVTVQASSSRSAPAAIPIAADSQTAVAVVRPCTAPRRVMMMPAPRKPMPVTIWAATRVEDDGARRQHVGKPVLADEQDQRGRRADDGLRAQSCALAWISRSRPMSAVSPNATKSSMI